MGKLVDTDSLVNLRKNIVNLVYPVGSVFMSESSDFNTVAKVEAYFPNTKWSKIEGRFLLGAGKAPEDAGTTYSAKGTGGSKNAIIVSHDHSVTTNGSTTGGSAPGTNSTGGHNHSHNTGGGIFAAFSSNDTQFGRLGVGVRQAGGSTGGGFLVISTTLTNQGTSNIQLQLETQGAHSHTVNDHGHSIPALTGTAATKGSSGTNANMPPHYNIYIYIRTA